MGNVCVDARRSFAKNGFFSTISGSIWRNRSAAPSSSPSEPTTTSRSVPVVQPTASAPPPEVKPPTPEPTPTAPPAPIVISEPARPPPQQHIQPAEKEANTPPPPPPSEQQPSSQPAQPQPRQQSRPKKPSGHIKRISSAGLQVQSVLRRKTDNLKDKYSLGRKLGQGQFGTTYLCVDKATGLEYACKSIAKRKLITDEDVEDVRREIQIMHHLAGHPNIISIRGAYEDAVAVHVVMELCAGGELFDRIVRRGHYTERQAAELARVIVAVVESCHSLGVMHRDLKPENFLFVGNEEDAALKTIDFGLSMFFRPGEMFSDVVGSPYYVAPEVLKKSYSQDADVWSAGVIVYILLCGVPPFWAETEQGIFEQVLNGTLDFESDPWPSVSEGAKDLLRKMSGEAPDKPLDSAVLSRLKQFSAMNKLKKMALRVSTGVIAVIYARLKEMFKMMDTDNSGQINYEELKAGLERVGANMKESDISQLMQAVAVRCCVCFVPPRRTWKPGQQPRTAVARGRRWWAATLGCPGSEDTAGGRGAESLCPRSEGQAPSSLALSSPPVIPFCDSGRQIRCWWGAGAQVACGSSTGSVEKPRISVPFEPVSSDARDRQDPADCCFLEAAADLRELEAEHAWAVLVTVVGPRPAVAAVAIHAEFQIRPQDMSIRAYFLADFLVLCLDVPMRNRLVDGGRVMAGGGFTLSLCPWLRQAKASSIRIPVEKEVDEAAVTAVVGDGKETLFWEDQWY
uniref:non-specific serine/threonine protein kinase n=1 Tax=Aegilops tauschii TaxID=37682 RepID=N1QYC0_AEGTA